MSGTQLEGREEPYWFEKRLHVIGSQSASHVAQKLVIQVSAFSASSFLHVMLIQRGMLNVANDSISS